MIDYMTEIARKITREEYKRHFEAPPPAQGDGGPTRIASRTRLIQRAGQLLYNLGTKLANLGRRFADGQEGLLEGAFQAENRRVRY